MQVTIERELCCSYRACAQACPEVFKHDEIGIAFVEQSVVPSEFEMAVRAAAGACPQGAIIVQES